MSLNHISPWFNGDTDDETSTTNNQPVPECKVWRNPLNLFRGSEYQRFYWAAAKEPLTYYDMNLSAQDHQTFFTCECDAGKAEYELMQTAWRERNPVVRIKTARDGKIVIVLMIKKLKQQQQQQVAMTMLLFIDKNLCVFFFSLL